MVLRAATGDQDLAAPGGERADREVLWRSGHPYVSRETSKIGGPERYRRSDTEGSRYGPSGLLDQRASWDLGAALRDGKVSIRPCGMARISIRPFGPTRSAGQRG